MELKKYIIMLVASLALFVGGCQSLPVKDPAPPTTITSVIKDKIEDAPIKDLGTLVMLEKNPTYVGRLMVSTFSSIILIFSGFRKVGISILIASITCLTLLYTLSIYAKIIAIVGLVILLAGFFFVGKSLYDNSIFAKEMVQSVQVSREYLLETNDNRLKDKLNVLQSKATKAAVKKIKTD